MEDYKGNYRGGQKEDHGGNRDQGSDRLEEHIGEHQGGLKRDYGTRPAFTSFLLWLAAGGMELCWLYAAAAFFMALVNRGPFPYLEAIGTFWLAAVLTLITRRSGWRVFQILLLHLAALGLAVRCILYVFYNQGAVPFLSQAWLPGIFVSSKGIREVFTLVLVLIFSGAFYLAGVALMRRPHTHFFIARRLDLGIGILFLLLLFDAGSGSSNSVTMFFLFPFFFLAMLALFLARNKGAGKKEFLPGQRRVGLILTFSVVVFIFALGAILFFIPYLTLAAETGLMLLKGISSPIFYSFLLPILKFMFGVRPGRGVSGTGDLPGDSSAMLPEAGAGNSLGGIFAKILGGGALGLAALVLLCTAAWGLRCLFRWLLSRSPQKGERGDLWTQFVLWLAAMRLYWEKLHLFMSRVALRPRPEGSEAVKIYRKLLRWGRSCGFPRLLYETPREYGLRLVSYFPALKSEVELIVGSFNRDIYGGIAVDKEQSALLRRAWRKLSSPLFWFL